MGRVTSLVRRLQGSQLSVQALSRLANVGVFLLASWVDTRHVALVAFQGALFAIPYTLLEALVGRPLSADVVPSTWNVESWATRAAGAVVLPVGVVGFLATSIAMPGTGIQDRLLVVAPVLLQLPLEALFWAMAKARLRRRANLVPQLVATGMLLTAAGFAATGVRLDIAAVPAQLAVLTWALATRLPVGPEQERPTVLRSVRVGAVYCVAAGIDLGYAVALPSFAGAVVGQTAIVVLRAMDLVFGPFHVALSATTREDIVAGRKSRWLTGVRMLTVASVLGISVVVIASPDVRRMLAVDLAATSLVAVTLYCAYKVSLMVSTWLATRHMIRATPWQFLISAIGSRVLAFGGLAVAVVWVASIKDLFLQLAVGEVLVALWFALRIRMTADVATERSVAPPLGPTKPATDVAGPLQTPVASGDRTGLV
jgi:hypothetical protein